MRFSVISLAISLKAVWTQAVSWSTDCLLGIDIVQVEDSVVEETGAWVVIGAEWARQNKAKAIKVWRLVAIIVASGGWSIYRSFWLLLSSELFFFAGDSGLGKALFYRIP